MMGISAETPGSRNIYQLLLYYLNWFYFNIWHKKRHDSKSMMKKYGLYCKTQQSFANAVTKSLVAQSLAPINTKINSGTAFKVFFIL